MDDDRDDDRPAKSSKVGYRNPPEHTRFQPGRSGNPRGRPKGSENIKTSIQKVLRTKIRIQENGRIRQAPLSEAIFKQLSSAALKGNMKASALFLQLAERYAPEDHLEDEIVTLITPLPFRWDEVNKRNLELEEEVRQLRAQLKKQSEKYEKHRAKISQ